MERLVQLLEVGERRVCRTHEPMRGTEVGEQGELVHVPQVWMVGIPRIKREHIQAHRCGPVIGPSFSKLVSSTVLTAAGDIPSWRRSPSRLLRRRRG